MEVENPSVVVLPAGEGGTIYNYIASGGHNNRERQWLSSPID